MTLPAQTADAPLSSLELRCPPLPQTLIEALQFSENPDSVSVKSVTEMVRRDPIVVARLLQSVNSAYYGLDRAVSTPEHAVVLLGPTAVVGIVAGMNVIRLRGVLNGPAASTISRLLEHNVAVAYVTRYLLRHVEEGSGSRGAQAVSDGMAFTAGLLHDFGKLILAYNQPDEAVGLYDQKLTQGVLKDANLRELESLTFGVDHTEAGEFAAMRFRFPEHLARVIRYHHTPEEYTADDEAGTLIRAVAAANAVAKACGHGFTGSISWQECAADPAWFELVTKDLPHLNMEGLLEDVYNERERVDLYVRAFSQELA